MGHKVMVKQQRHRIHSELMQSMGELKEKSNSSADGADVILIALTDSSEAASCVMVN